MKTYTIPTRENVAPEVQKIFDDLEKNIGMVPNLYAFMGLSATAFPGYISFQQRLTNGTFNAREREAIYLAVSEVNNCRYCKSVHTAVGKMNGFSDEQTLQLRNGTHPDPNLNTLTRLAASIQSNRGRPDPALLEMFYELGYDEEGLIDLVALVTDKVFANYIHNMTNLEIDFPRAPELDEAV